MSKHVAPTESMAFETGLEALQSGSEFRGPIEPLNGHEHANDHFALIYESQKEQFAAAIPFIQQGLDRGERCLYITHENSREEVVAAMRTYGIDVDAALDSGALSIHDEKETYLRNGTFDADETIEFLDAAIEEATEEYEALRVTGEMSSVLREDPDGEELVKCEAKANYLFDDVDGIALCQYNRNRFPSDVIRDVISTHPLLIHDNRISHNVYYTPPEEFFGPEKTELEIDRLLGALREQTDTKAELQQRERYLRESYEITSAPDLGFEEKLQSLFELGCEQFGFELGAMAEVTPETDRFEVQYVSTDHEHFEPGLELPLSETYCTAATNADGVAYVDDPIEGGYDEIHVYREFDIEAYLGTYIEVEDDTNRTFFFVSEEPRDEGFSDAERTFQRLMGQWVKYELERKRRERELRDRKQHLSALVETTPECIKTVADDGTLIQMNPAGLDMVEADSGSEVIGESVYDLIAPEHRQKFREFNERICQGERDTLEFDIIGLEGTRRHMESHAAPLRHPDGSISHVALTRDVTEQVEREAELRQTKNRFETVFEQSDDAIFLLDPEADEHVDVNPAACELVGYACDELLSLELSDLYPDDMEQIRAFVDKVYENGSAWTEDIFCRTEDGRDIPVEMTASTITLDGRDLILANVRHIEERKKHERYQRELYEISSDPDLGFEEKLERVLELGRERFDLEMAGLNQLPTWDGEFRLEKGVGLDVDPDETLWTDPDVGCYCRQTITEDEPVEMTDVHGTHWTEDAIYQEVGITSYLGTKVSTGSTPYGTLWFGSTEPRTEPFSDAERSFIELIGQWVSYEIAQRDHEHSQRKLYEITADSELETDEKIERLLEVGCDRLGLPVGMLNRDQGAALEVQQMHGDHPALCEGAFTPPSSDHYCREVVDTGDPLTVADAEAVGWDDDPFYEEIGLETYAGMPVTVGDDTYGTLCFADTSPRQAAFTEAEQAFLDLVGQCVSYELDRSHRETRLHVLNGIGRELLDAETPAEIAEGVVETVEDAFETPVNAVALYDDEMGTLRPVAHTDAAAELVETAGLFGSPDGAGWNAFIENQTKWVTDPLDCADTDPATEPPQPPISEAVVHPLGNHGVYLVGTRTPNGFRRGAAEVIETGAANVRAALDRTDRERELQEREQVLEEQNETLERLNRINDTIRRLDQALVEASTRDEIERVVCEELADSGPYELAWIGDDGVTGEVTPTEWAGTEKGYLDAITITSDDRPEGNGPTGRAIKTGEPQVVNNVLRDESFEPWRQDALNRGYHATAALPLTYDDTQYGVLNLYAGQPAVFDSLEREVLAELSNTVAHAINAIESKKALVSDQVTELEFAVEDSGLEVVELTRELDCEFALERLTLQSDGGMRAFFSVRGAPAADVLEFEPRLAVTDLRLVSDADDDSPCLFEATLTEESLSRAILDHGGRLQSVHIEDGTATVVVHLATEADVCEFTEMFQSKYPDSELRAQRTEDLPQQTALEFVTALTDDLTNRQEESLQMAYLNGYFEEPRMQTATEIASSMDISQPTFNSHLRAAIRKLCRRIYENDTASV